MRLLIILLSILLLSFNSLSNHNNGIDEIEWETIKTWSGSGITNTEPFRINTDFWRVNWTSSASEFSRQNQGAGHIFQIYLQRPGNELFMDILANVANEVRSSDTSYVYRKGQFYLTMNGGNGNWIVEVQVPK